MNWTRIAKLRAGAKAETKGSFELRYKEDASGRIKP
jgi:hypothetical protein